MKREVISEIFNDVSKEYILESLELPYHDKVSELKPMKNKKRIVTIVIAASFVCTLGITAFATGFFGMTENKRNPEETLVVVDDVYVGDNQYESMAYTYDNVETYYTFNGPDSCNAIEIKAAIPESYTVYNSSNNGWYSGIVASYETDEYITFGDDPEDGYYREEALNVQIFYSSQFGDDGMLFMQNDISVVSDTTNENLQIIELYDNDQAEYYKLMYNTEEGYLIVVSGTCQNDVNTVFDTLEISQTDEIIEYNESANHNIYLCTGLG